MDDISWNRAKQNFRTKYNFELQDDDRELYVQYTSKYPKGPQCFIVFMALTLLFIVVGIFIGELTLDQYTLVPFGVVVFLLVMNANDLTKKIETIDKKLIEEIRNRRGQSFQTPIHQTVNVTQQNIMKPKPASICPICGKTIPYKAEICNFCGQPLIWE
jgi:methyl-accepting chemotaxis protein